MTRGVSEVFEMWALHGFSVGQSPRLRVCLHRGQTHEVASAKGLASRQTAENYAQRMSKWPAGQHSKVETRVAEGNEKAKLGQTASLKSNIATPLVAQCRKMTLCIWQDGYFHLCESKIHLEDQRSYVVHARASGGATWSGAGLGGPSTPETCL
jgi:hypothetical protein